MDRASRVKASVLTASILVGALVLAGLTSCSGATHRARTGSLVWHGCGAIECASLSVPLDWSRPSGRHIVLALARRPARTHRLGVLLTNPGGPGGSGIDFVRDAADTFDGSIRDRFDIVSWDPRGVGRSAPASCGDHLDYFYAVDRNGTDAATTRANELVAKRFAADCARAAGPLLPYLSTRDTVRDMDAIRAAMGEATIDYLGFSYGTYIGALYADRYPHRVRAMVLDGAVDPAASYANGVILQSVGFEHALDAFFTWCRGNRDCAFARSGNPERAFDDLMQSIAGKTDPGTVQGEHRNLGIGEANIGVASALYAGNTDEGWVALGKALNDAARGDGSGLLKLSDAYTGRKTGGTYDNLTAAFYSISCIDAPAPARIDAIQRLAARAARAAPHFGASTTWLGLPCTFWPARAVDPPAPLHAVGAPPIVVVGNTDDPATPYIQAHALARELRSGRLLTFVGEGHTEYGRGNRCIDDAVDRYLISLAVPAAGKRCS